MAATDAASGTALPRPLPRPTLPREGEESRTVSAREGTGRRLTDGPDSGCTRQATTRRSDRCAWRLHAV